MINRQPDWADLPDELYLINPAGRLTVVDKRAAQKTPVFEFDQRTQRYTLDPHWELASEAQVREWNAKHKAPGRRYGSPKPPSKAERAKLAAAYFGPGPVATPGGEEKPPVGSAGPDGE